MRFFPPRRRKFLRIAPTLALCAALFLAAALSSCSASGGPGAEGGAAGASGPGEGAAGASGGDPPFTVVCTGFSQYDWTRNLLAGCENSWEIVRLNDKGADMHSYQPSARDVAEVSRCDLLIYTGGLSEQWLTDALASDSCACGRAYCLLDNVQGRAESSKELGIGHDEHAGGSAGSEDMETDEHVWLSPANAAVFAGDIAEELAAVDVQNAAVYRENAAAYVEKLRALDEAYGDAASRAENKALIFADRFPFRYPADEYALTCFAAFPGCSAETEASFDTVLFLAEKVKEYDAGVLLITERSSDDLAQTVARACNAKGISVRQVNSLQSVNDEDIRRGLTYLGAMYENLAVFKEALGLQTALDR